MEGQIGNTHKRLEVMKSKFVTADKRLRRPHDVREALDAVREDPRLRKRDTLAVVAIDIFRNQLIVEHHERYARATSVYQSPHSSNPEAKY